MSSSQDGDYDGRGSDSLAGIWQGRLQLRTKTEAQTSWHDRLLSVGTIGPEPSVPMSRQCGVTAKCTKDPQRQSSTHSQGHRSYAEAKLDQGLVPLLTPPQS
jgi:hypothetical protein